MVSPPRDTSPWMGHSWGSGEALRAEREAKVVDKENVASWFQGLVGRLSRGGWGCAGLQQGLLSPLAAPSPRRCPSKATCNGGGDRSSAISGSPAVRLRKST